MQEVILVNSLVNGLTSFSWSKHRNIQLGDALVPVLFYMPICGLTTVTTFALLVKNPSKVNISTAILGFGVGNLVGYFSYRR